MKKANELNVRGMTVRVVKIGGEDFVCLTDMAKLKSDDAQQTISNWMRNRMTIEYLGLWEYLYNPSFKPLEFEGFRNEVGLNSFTMSPSKWIEGVNAVGMVVQAGRYGGTYARNDIAFKFGQTHQQWQAQHPDLSTGKVKSAYRGGLIPLQGTWHIPTGDTACTGGGLAMKRPGRLGSASKPASRRVNTRQSATPNPPVDGSIPASRPGRRQAGIRFASSGSLLPLRRFPWGPYRRVLRRMMRAVV